MIAQIDRLGLSDRDFLKRASVFGRTAWVEGVLSLGAENDALAALRKQGFAAPKARSRFGDAREFSIRNALLQEVAYGLWTEKQREGLHHRAAEWLAAQTGATPDETARHWEFAGDLSRAAEAYVAAAEAAAHVNDERLAAHVARALVLTSDPQLRFRVLVAQDAALQSGGDPVAQREGLEALDRLLPSLGLAERAEIACRRLSFARMTGDHAAAREFGAVALDYASRAETARWHAAAHYELAFLAADEARFDEALDHASRAQELVAAVDDAWLVARVTATRAYVLTEEGRALGGAVRLHAEAAAAYAAAGDRRREAVCLSNGGFALLQLGRVADAMERFETAIALSRRVGNTRTAAVATQNRGTIHRILGEFEKARADFDVAAREATRLRFGRLLAAVATERAYLALAERASASTLIEAADEAERLAPATRSPSMIASAFAVALRARASAGLDTSDAARDARTRLATGEIPHDGIAELAVAVCEAGGRTPGDLAFVRAALDAWSNRVASDAERSACRRTFITRFVASDVLDR